MKTITRLSLALVAALLSRVPPARAGVQVLKEVPSTYVYPVDGHIPFNIHRGTPTLLALMLPGASFNNPQGVACALLKSTDNPKDPLDDVEITVLGLNSGAGELFYNVGLRNVRRMGSSGRGLNQFQDPLSVALHPSGDAAVADTGNHRIVLLKHDGYRLSWVKTLGGRGSGPGQFQFPTGVAYDSAGDLYVADRGNNRIQVRDRNGVWGVLPIEGLSGPTALAVVDHAEPWTFFTTGPYSDRIAVVDRDGTRVQTFSLAGAPLAFLTAEAAGDPPFHLTACAFDYYGHLVATDDRHSCLRKLDRDLKPLALFGTYGDGDYQFRAPRGICLNKQLGQIVVSEEESVQYLWVGADALNLRAIPIDNGTAFRFYLTEPAYVSGVILGPDGAQLAEVAKDSQLDERERALSWIPPPGTAKGAYRLRLTVMATYSSRDRLAKVETLDFNYVGPTKRGSAPAEVIIAPAAPTSTPTALTAPAPTPTLPYRTLGEALRESRAERGLHDIPLPTPVPDDSPVPAVSPLPTQVPTPVP